MQGYNLEIRHIPGKRNPADTLSRQDKKDALGRKTAVHDANADLVRELRVPSDAGDEAIQEALKKLFNQVQAQSSQTQSVQFSSAVRVSVQRSRHQAQIKTSSLKLSSVSRSDQCTTASVRVQFKQDYPVYNSNSTKQYYD